MSAIITAAINGYATQHEYDIISEPLEINGGVYYHLNKSVRPRYLGHPCVVKINKSGRVVKVRNTNEIYRAVALIKEHAK